MNLFDLAKFVENKMDKAILETMIQERKDGLNQRIGNLMFTYIDAFNLNIEERKNIKYKIEGFNADSFGGVATYLLLIPIFSVIYENDEKAEILIKELIITLMRYLTMDIGKGEFVERIWELEEVIGLSDGFFNSLNDYFGEQKNAIIQPILPRICKIRNVEQKSTVKSRYIWDLHKVKVKELDDLNAMKQFNPFLYQGSRFYLTYYICPCCQKHLLYKTNTTGDFTVVSNSEKVNVTSVFTCAPCKSFYASKPNKKLSDGDGFKIEHLTEDSYAALLKDIESVGKLG